MKETIRQLEEWGGIGGNEKFFKRAASIRKALEKLEAVKRPVMERRSADFELNPLDRSGRKVITFEGVTKKFGEKMILNGAEGNLLYGEKIVLLGDNGSGKTTLFKLLQGMITPDAGVVVQGARVEIGYLAQQELVKDNKLTVLEHFKSEGNLEEGEARNMLAKYLFYGADVFKPLQMLSGGEWSRLRLALLVMRKPNLLLLDEPTNHLDMASREALEEALEDFPGTILAISHDRYFINRLAKCVWELKQGTISTYLGNYDDFKEHYRDRASEDCMPVSGAPRKPVRQQRNTKVVASSTASLTNERRCEKLELEIAALEEKLTISDADLQHVDQIGDAALLESKWLEREELQSQLDTLIALWMELSS